MARIVFMGTPAFAVPSLEAMARDHEVAAVYSQPPRPSGRGMKTRPSAVHARAEDLGAVETPLRLDAGAQETLPVTLLIFIVVAYGLILPEPVLALPRKAAINGHASLLPRWRGAALIHRAIVAGDTVTGVTAMLMAKSLDSGPMLAAREEPIRDDDTTASLHDRLASLTATVLTEAVAGFDHLTPVDQNEADVTWAEKITPAEAEIDFTRPAAEIERRIRAFAPFPGAWFSIRRDDGNSQRIKVLAAEITSGQGQPGTVLGTVGTGPEIAAAAGALVLTRVQPQGKAGDGWRGFSQRQYPAPQIIRSEQG